MSLWEEPSTAKLLVHSWCPGEEGENRKMGRVREKKKEEEEEKEEEEGREGGGRKGLSVLSTVMPLVISCRWSAPPRVSPHDGNFPTHEPLGDI